MDRIPYWLHRRLKLLLQYLGVFLASLPLGGLFLVLLKAGFTERGALVIIVPLGLIVAHFAWRIVDKRIVLILSVREREEQSLPATVVTIRTNQRLIGFATLHLAGTLVITVVPAYSGQSPAAGEVPTQCASSNLVMPETNDGRAQYRFLHSL